jgi:PAS domain S-box-containing protein
MEKFSSDPAFILIVDDKPGNIRAMQSLLEHFDRKFYQASNGQEALKIALNNEVDLIILDVQMPDMDGYEVAEILRSNKRTKDIPIIFASAEKTEQHAVLKGFEEGAIDYLSKPLNPDVTKAKVGVLLKLQRQQKELMKKNASLLKSELLINNSADIIGVIDAATLIIESVNRAFTIILGYSHLEINGTPLTLFLSDEDRSRLQKLQHSSSERISFETQIYCKDRSTKWLGWHVVIKDDKWFFNARDITEIKQVDKIRNHLATVVKQSSDAVYLHNSEGKIISWNNGAEKIYGYSEDEALKMKVWNIIPLYLHPEAENLFNSILNGEKVLSLETKRVTKHGKFVDVLFSASAIAGTDADQKAIAITERDITLQKAASEQIRELNNSLQKNVMQLEETNKELEAFSYSVSHDLRAPLRALSGNARILEEDYSSILDDGAKRILDKIYNNVKKMDRLIEDLLAFAKVSKKEVRKYQVSMEEQVKQILTEISMQSNVSIKLGHLPDAFVDASLFNQIWVNLISNAIKYSAKKENAEVEIGSTQAGGETIYFVRDNGAGFDMNYADKLFRPFQRLHDSSEFEGTGIGLAIVNRIVTKHGGRIWAEAKPDEGACFYFAVPAILSNSNGHS